MRRLAVAAAAAATAASILACTGRLGGGGGEEMDPEVQEALESLQPTAFEARNDGAAMIFDLQGGGAPPMDSGAGVQVVHVAPLGDGRKALQAAVVFDRPMVPLSDLDAMSDTVPLNCEPDIPHRARWAGTTTAVWVPDTGSFPLAHAFTCTVPAGTKAMDGIALEKDIRWTFELARPFVETLDANRSRRWDPARPLTLRFSQPVTPEAVRPKLSIRAGSSDVPFTVEATEDPRSLLVRAKLEKDTAYAVHVDAGVVGTLGPLPSQSTFDASFDTYPPFRLVSMSPDGGTVEPWAELELEFTTDVAQDLVAKHLTLSPDPDGWGDDFGGWTTTRWHHWRSLAPRTTYTLKLDDGLEDEYGQKLEAGSEVTFTTGDYRPSMKVATGLRVYAAHDPRELPIHHMNCDEVFVRAAAVPVEETLRRWKRGDLSSVFPGPSGMPLTALETSPEPNQWEIDMFDLGPLSGTGAIAVETWSPQRVNTWNDEIVRDRALYIVAALGVTEKVSPNQVQAWVTRLEDGKPVAGAEVTVSIGTRILGTATTDGSGLATVNQGPGAGWSQWQEGPVLAIARKGQDLGVTFSDWADGISPWRYGLYADWDWDGEDLAGWGYADRGIYKRGDPVYARAHYRLEDAQGLHLPGDGKASWTLRDPDGAVATTGTVDVKGGDLSIQTAIPEDGMLGDWSIDVEADFGPQRKRDVYISVPARAYREPAFRVSVHTDTDKLSAEPVGAWVDARYMFGAPLGKGKVEWRAWTTSASFTPEGYDGWWFGPERHWWWDDEYEGEGGYGMLSTAQAELAAGAAEWTVNAPEGLTAPVDLHVEAEVEDVDRQAIAGNATARIHPTSAYVGLKLKERLPTADKPSAVELIALTPQGEKAAAAPTHVEAILRTWDVTRQKGVDGRWEWVSNESEEVVASAELSVGGGGATWSWTPPKAGTYVIRATRTEDGGRSQVAEDRVYALGPGYASWGIDEDQMLRLVPEKPTWHIGETARILVQSPVPDLQGLVTVEREGVLWSKVVRLEGTATTVEIPIDPAWLPNVYVSVVSVEGAPPQDSPDAGMPQVRVGMVELTVDKEDARLAVDVKTDRDSYGPRDPVAVDLVVTDAKGKPAAGVPVNLYAVDESVLSLTNYQTPDPISGLYRHRELSGYTGDSRTVVVDRAKYLTKGAPDAGGGGMEDGPEIREKFVTTITWQPDLVTGPDGRIAAKFELPDNLTAFRVMAVATAADRFGAGDREITVTKPVLLRTALPRRLRVDDVAFAGVVVHNNTDTDQLAAINAAVEGPVELGGSPVLVPVPAHQALEVPFRIRATGTGQAKFTFDVKAGTYRDAVAWPLTLEEDIPLEVVATSGTTDERAVETIAMPATNRRDLGGLTIDVGTSALAGAGSGLEYLVEYPHGCVEQITSRGLGALVTMQVRQHAGLTMSEAELRAVVEAALGRLPRFEVHNRGLGYWPGAWEPSPIGTAYAVEFMGRARAAGFPVDEALLERSSNYLRSVLSRKDLPGWDPLTSAQVRAYVAVALARAGEGDAGANSNLFAQKDNLSLASTAALLEAIARTTGADGRTAALQKTLESRAYIDATSASIKENDTNRWARLWGSDDLATAAALEGILVANGQHPLAPKLALHLASSKTSGRWANTRATAGVLAALAKYADLYEHDGDPRKISITMAGKELLAETLEIPNATQKIVRLEDLVAGELAVQSNGGRIYYQERLEYAPIEQKPRDEGFTVIRDIEVVDGGGPGGAVTAGATLAVTLRVVTPVVRHDVAVVDPFPAGLEPLDRSLATASQAPSEQPDTSGDDEGGTDELPAYGGSWVYDHTEIDDLEVRLYADYMPPGIHTFRYAARATSPGTYSQPPARVEAMYQPEIFGRTSGGQMTIGRTAAVAGK